MLKEVKLTPEQAKKAADFFNRIHAEAREAAAKDPNHPYNAYLWAINGGLDAALKVKREERPEGAIHGQAGVQAPGPEVSQGPELPPQEAGAHYPEGGLIGTDPDGGLIGTDPDLQAHLRAIADAYQEHLQSKLPTKEP